MQPNTLTRWEHKGKFYVKKFTKNPEQDPDPDPKPTEK